MNKNGVLAPVGLSTLLLLPVLAMTWLLIQKYGTTPGAALAALWNSSPDTPAELILHYSWWPRLVTTLLAGGAMAVAGVLMQQVLRNPLASPTTLGVTSGATLALLLATVYAPSLLQYGSGAVALAGGLLGMGLVFLLAWRSALSPTVVILAGLIVSLYCGALSTVLFLFHKEALVGVPFWGAGSLVQSNWDDPLYLLPRLFLAMGAALLFIRPLSLLDLSDEAASSLGASLLKLRFAGLGLAVLITAWVVSAVGVIGFIGLAAPVIVRLLGVRALHARLLWSGVMGALLLVMTDQALQMLPDQVGMLLPTGAATAVLGAPLMLWLLPRLRLESAQAPTARRRQPLPVSNHRMYIMLLLSVASLGGLFVLTGQEMGSWAWLPESGNWQLLELRWPRLLAAASAGAMLALAGTVLQRLTANPMASPELLGVSSGAAIAMIIAIIAGVGSVSWGLYGAGIGGALGALALIYLLNRRSGFIPARVLLTGVAINALMDAMQHMLLIDLSGNQLLGWLSGTTYFVSSATALMASGLTVLLLLLSLLLTRWLDIMPLGSAQSAAMGIPVNRARLLMLALVASMSTAATLLVGPFSFVGLMAPHMARMLGFNRACAHLLASALVGVLLMICADWLGRQWLYPQEIPVGLMSALIGGGYLMWGLRRF